ncbi:hypothetical protein FRX31_025984 [Thalictrum thalictroides]|uniref:Reverse transcriptase zinc-binding domain-containing protein n=1 Tax=Thalictrum thalictroides TaxID=46969 RepID=A0A7J6VIN2_THATH|nr:hypothetical protein FRX31_025984 [Thalictrum thalictroides]
MKLIAPFKQGVSYRLGDGQHIKFWRDNWAGELALETQFPLIFRLAVDKEVRVCDVRMSDADSVSWNVMLRRNRYDWEEQQMNDLAALLDQVVAEEGDDLWVWKWSRTGQFSVKTMYVKLRELETGASSYPIAFPYKVVWCRSIPLNIKFFLWTLMLGRTLTLDRLINMGIALPPVCFMCGMANESTTHLFLHCSKALQLWASLIQSPFIFSNLFGMDSIQEWLVAWPERKGPEITRWIWNLLPVAVIWVIWKNRNDKAFRDREFSVSKLEKEIKCTIWYWCGVWTGRKHYFFRDLMVSWKDILQGDLIR